VAANTLACTAPKKTMFELAVGLKFAPAMVTTVPLGPDNGETF